MMDDQWDADMRVVRQAMDAAAAQEPPTVMAEPFDACRIISERLALAWVDAEPVMAETREYWVLAQGRRVQCRVHRPRTDRKLPVLVWFHGGGWVLHSIDTHDGLAREYAAAAEVAVVSVDYALAPEARFPKALLECASVVRQLADMDWGVDASRIVLGGDSAGGNLAFATALALRDSGGPALRGILALYPVVDCDFTLPSYLEYATGFGMTGASMHVFWDLYARDAADRLNPLASPLRANLAGMPRTLLQLAELDVLRSEGELMADKLRKAGVDVTLQHYSGVLHGFVRLVRSVAKARLAVDDAAAWLRETLA
jgi:acetyl esterase